MKHFLIRLAIYVPIISFFWPIFVPGFFDPLPMQGSVLLQAPGYIAFYGITYGFWIAAYELCYRAAKYVRKPKPLPVPDTRPLYPFNQDAYGKLHVDIQIPFPLPSDAIDQSSNPTRPVDSP